MDRQANDYAAAASAMAFAQQQRPGANMQQQQQFGFHPQHQQFPPPPFIPPLPSMQQFPYPHHLLQQPASQLHPHLPPHPQLLHQQQPHPSFTPHLPPHMLPSPFHALHDSPPPPAPPPSDPELQKRIDKLVEYAIKNGPEFEVMIREKQHDNPAYSFLFGGEGHNYYHYKLWLSTHASGSPFNPPFPPSSSLPMMHHPPNAMMNPTVGASAPMVGTHPMHQPPFPPFYDAHLLPQRPPAFGFLGRPDFDQSSKHFRSLLPPDVAMEITNVLNSLNGTKESIKGAKVWFMQRSTFAPALAEALKERVFALDDSERQLHIIYLANDILFDGLQRRMNLHELDNEAIAFKPVLGSMLARIYHNVQNQEENQSRLQKILQFWALKEVFDQDTIHALESEMVGGLPAGSFAGPAKDLSSVSADSMVAAGFPQQAVSQNAPQWQPDRQNILDQEHLEKKAHPTIAASLGNQQFMPNSVSAGTFPGPVLMNASIQSANQIPVPHLSQAPPASIGEKLPPYPLFPPGLIPGMVRKMQIGSGVPYSPLSPLDIPTIIPPSDMAPTEILERVSKFFKEIGEINPSEGPMTSNAKDEYDEYDRESPVRKGGACIPPPPNLQVDPETGAYPDGSVERKPGSNGSGRLGLGATADPNEPSQYDDVYTSYRKQRSTNYHSSMSARASAR